MARHRFEYANFSPDADPARVAEDVAAIVRAALRDRRRPPATWRVLAIFSKRYNEHAVVLTDDPAVRTKADALRRYEAEMKAVYRGIGRASA